MQHREDDFSEGDSCYLFQKFPFDWSLHSKLPIELAPGISIVLTPQHALQKSAPKGSSTKEHIALSAYIYPGYGLPGLGICNVCIKIDSRVPPKERDDCFRLFMGALLLEKPLNIITTGSFTYGTLESGFVGFPNICQYESKTCLDWYFKEDVKNEGFLLYNGKELKQAGVYYLRCVQIFELKETCHRPWFNLMTFFKAILFGNYKYASDCFSKLFSVVDSLAGNPSHKHGEKVSNRISLFIGGPERNVALCKSRMLSIWKFYRASHIHGYPKDSDFPTSNNGTKASINNEENKDLFVLMEITRVAIIKMLRLDKASFHEYCEIPRQPSEHQDKTHKKDSEKERESASKKFFEGKTHTNPKQIISYIDFSDL